MPRNKRHGNVGGSEATDTATLQESAAVTTTEATEATTEETDTTPTFSFDVEPAPADFEPNRKSPGRTRRPSPYDNVLKREDIFGKSWQFVRVTSAEHKAAVIAELNRAKSHLGVGLDLDVTQDDVVAFKSRELQKRERKTEENGNGEGAQAEGLDTSDPEGDNDE